ncbi:hypothetical protein [Natrarchaeobius oligotrophus]|uniref:Uncharacterized protein n=1 Tax=Natrarchaeobius chitinivorans TaxID=1679083 RepID=A0A3N6MNK1_NATCH|nr:hypothetical protein [Natrarchaeobius chitinivorans]RQH03235.1 hypothetical protein EA472_01220 [Natrarchaeobius chitinivorans]
MGQRRNEPRDALTIERAARRLGVEDVADVARAAYDHAGELAALEYGRTAAVLGACRLASRRGRGETLTRDRIAAAFDVGYEDVVEADCDIASHLAPPADADDVRSLRRTLIVASELLAAVERGRPGLDFPGSYLADAAPWLLGRAVRSHERSTDGRLAFDEAELRAHADRLEADLELARLGTTLYARVRDEPVAPSVGSEKR